MKVELNEVEVKELLEILEEDLKSVEDDINASQCCIDAIEDYMDIDEDAPQALKDEYKVMISLLERENSILRTLIAVKKQIINN